jgi:hypothetical protein
MYEAVGTQKQESTILNELERMDEVQPEGYAWAHAVAIGTCTGMPG